MSDHSRIGWTQATWNVVTGCDRVSAGCDHCYALTLAARLNAMGNPRYQHDGDPRTSGPGFGVTLHHDKLDQPYHWRAPRLVFVNSMSDLFHPKVPDDFIVEVFVAMAIAGQHTFQVLTKRPKRMRALLADPMVSGRVRDRVLGGWPLPNVWVGTSVEDQQHADRRIPDLLATPAAVRFLSCEPLLGPVDLSEWLWWPFEPANLRSYRRRGALRWVIVGGESGPGARPMNIDWATDLVEQCAAAGVALFVKQDSGPRPGTKGRLDDELWACKQFPVPVPVPKLPGAAP